MKCIRLIISKTGYKALKAFADDNYLYEYIVNNSSELDEINILNNPTLKKEIGDYIFFSKDNISYEDEIIWIQSIQDIKTKNASYYAVILDTETHEMKILKNLSGNINLPIVNMPIKFDDFEIIKKIEEYVLNEVNNYMEIE